MKYSGKIGFWEGDEEVSPGRWKPKIIERGYVGDVLNSARRLQLTNQINPEFTTTSRLSILSDLYLRQNWGTIRYVEWNGILWEVSSVEVDHPRVTLNLGGKYNGEKTRNSEANPM